MKIKHFLQLIILFLWIVLGVNNASAALQADTAKQWALQKGKQIIDILTDENSDEKYAALDKILVEDIDLNYAAKFVVGKYWRAMDESQHREYENLFKRYISALYKEYPLSLPKGSISFTVDKALSNSQTVSVWCTIFVDAILSEENDNNKKGFKVLFELIQNNSQIMVRDLKIEQSSLLLAFRERFQQMIHQDNDDEIAWFLEDLQAIVESMEEKHLQ